jgi:hypothetical protein
MARKNLIKAIPDRRRKPLPSLPSPVPSSVPAVIPHPYGRREGDAQLGRMKNWVAIADATFKEQAVPSKKESTRRKSSGR